jgi:hypothetical protein
MNSTPFWLYRIARYDSANGRSRTMFVCLGGLPIPIGQRHPSIRCSEPPKACTNS